MARKKVSVIGAGNVGATVAQEIAQRELADVVLTDIIEGFPQGKALDLFQTAPIDGYDSRLSGTNNLEDIAGSDLVVITAGFPRKPGMDRMDLLKKNLEIVGGVVDQIVSHAPDAMILVVTNPLDVMTYLAFKKSGFGKKRVFGQAGVLDTARFSAFIAMELGCSVKDIRAMVLGGHGDSMVPLRGHASVSGIPVSDLIPKDRLDAMIERTRKGGGEIVSLLKRGSAYYAPGAATAAMVGSILNDERRILPTCCFLEGEYGLERVYAGVPAILGAGGVEKVVEVTLSDEERDALHKSADHVKKGMEEIDQLLG
ncbi:MAG: malate dehydrogenase [Planctomycetota bacterium]|nr:malate dehydrogenase [Planctomycetota bacterium]